MKKQKRGNLINLKNGYAIRLFLNGKRLYETGFRTQREAYQWVNNVLNTFN